MKLAECRVVTPIGTSDYTAYVVCHARLSMLFRPLQYHRCNDLFVQKRAHKWRRFNG
jgi:hypothetical protein